MCGSHARTHLQPVSTGLRERLQPPKLRPRKRHKKRPPLFHSVPKANKTRTQPTPRIRNEPRPRKCHQKPARQANKKRTTPPGSQITKRTRHSEALTSPRPASRSATTPRPKIRNQATGRPQMAQKPALSVPFCSKSEQTTNIDPPFLPNELPRPPILRLYSASHR